MYGEPDVIEVRKTFKTSTQAREWETRVLRYLKVITRDDYLNQTDNISICPEAVSKANKGRKRPDVALRNKTRWTNKEKTGKPRSLETRNKISESRRAYFETAAGRAEKARISNRHKNNKRHLGKKRSLETKLLMSSQRKDTIFITDGIKNKRVSKDHILEHGWRYGMTKSSNGRIKKIP